MLIRGELDINSVQNCNNSIKQRLKQTMLNQELVFMRQAEFMRFENFSSQLEWHRLPGFTQRPLDLQLSADQFISCSTDQFIGKGILGGSLNETFKSKNSSQGEFDDLNLSLRIGEDAGEKSRFHGSWFRKKPSLSSVEIIDLEDSNLVFSKSNGYLGKTSIFSAPDISNGTQFFTSLMATQPLAPDSGITVQMSVDFLSKNKKLETKNMDLNVVEFEESSCFSNDIALNPSQTSLSFRSPTFRKNAKVNQSVETLDVPQQLDLNVDLAVTTGTEICFIDLDSDEDLGNSKSNPKFESVGSMSKGLACDATIRTEENLETDAVWPTHSHSCQNSKDNAESDCIDQSSSVKTMQSGVKCRDLNISASNKSQSDDDMGYSEDQDRISSESTESNVQCIVRSEPVDDNDMVQKAAELLVQISLQRQEMGSKDEENETECSSDSYAAMVLMEKESGPDDYCVSSNAFVVDELEKKENRCKLKRGTRIKDFQKDILPGLSILSRHEIREDIHIMEGVIRSREYKKMRSKFGDEGDWCRTRRSKRSRVQCSRR